MRGWVGSYPAHDHVLSNIDFIDNTADYYGLESHAVSALRTWHCAHVSYSSISKGDDWRIQHNSAQHFMWRALNDHGVRSQIKRYSLFDDVFDDLHRARPDLWDEMRPSTRHGAVPDIGANFAGEAELLFEVKMMHENLSCYWSTPRAPRAASYSVHLVCVRARAARAGLPGLSQLGSAPAKLTNRSALTF